MNALHYAADAWSLKAAMGEGEKIINNLIPNNFTKGSNRASVASNRGSQVVKEAEEEDIIPEALNRPHGSTTIKVLLLAGIYPNLKDANGRTPLHVLAESDAATLYLNEPLEEPEDEEDGARLSSGSLEADSMSRFLNRIIDDLISFGSHHKFNSND